MILLFEGETVEWLEGDAIKGGKTLLDGGSDRQYNPAGTHVLVVLSHTRQPVWVLEKSLRIIPQRND